MVTLELQEDEGPWEQKTTLQGDGIIIIGRSDFSSLPSFLSRQHLALWYDKGIAYTKPLGQNKSFLRRNLTDSIWPQIEALAKGVATAVPLGAVLLLEKSHRFKVRLVGPAPAAASAASAGAAASADAQPENKEAEQVQPPHSRELPAAMPAAAAPAAVPAAPVVIELDDSEQEEDDEVEVEARGVRRRRGKPPPPAAEVVDLEAEEKPEERPGEKAAARREGKRPLALPAEEEERARPRRPSATPVPPTHEVIDLEAATGVGVGVSGRPLLPGEQEARRQLQRRSWTLRASRSTDDTPEESHFRFAESAWCRGGGQAAQIESVEYHFSPQLEAAWHAKKAEYDARFGAGNHTILFAFHGTRPANVDPILSYGFQVSKVGSTTDAGYFGAGIYFSEQLQHSQCYNNGNGGMFLCKLLIGKPYQCTQQNGRGLEPGFTSHVSDAGGAEVRPHRVHRGALLSRHRAALCRVLCDTAPCNAPCSAPSSAPCPCPCMCRWSSLTTRRCCPSMLSRPRHHPHLATTRT